MMYEIQINTNVLNTCLPAGRLINTNVQIKAKYCCNQNVIKLDTVCAFAQPLNLLKGCGDFPAYRQAGIGISGKNSVATKTRRHQVFTKKIQTDTLPYILQCNK